MPNPDIQSSSELDDPGIGAGWPKVRSVPIEERGFPETTVAASRANPRSDSLAGKNIQTHGGSDEQRSDVLGNHVVAVVQVHPRIDRYGHFPVQSEDLVALEQATVIELDHFLAPEMNGQARTLNRLGTDESSARRDGKLIDLRQGAGHEN